MARIVHHVEFSVSDLKFSCDFFQKKLGFSPLGYQTSSLGHSNVFYKDNVVIVLSSANKNALNNNSYKERSSAYFSPVLLTNKDNFPTAPDSVASIALEVTNVQEFHEKALKHGAAQIQEYTELKSIKGVVKYSVVYSSLERLFYTFISSCSYEGSFLPGFVITHEELDGLSESNHFVDHLAICTASGSGQKLLRWFTDGLQMKRFFLNSSETTAGIQIRNVDGSSGGMNLMATELCNKKCQSQSKIMFVIAEESKGSGPNQVTEFIADADGPGVNHIAINCTKIEETVKSMKQRGVNFIDVPVKYYDELSILYPKKEFPIYDIPTLKLHSVLLDIERKHDETHDTDSYLFQTFTKPVFRRKGYFFELIQRHGAIGLGEANIIALWKAVQAIIM